MRLIDVDNFLKQYSNQIPGDTIDAIDLRLALLKEPKVEAIPIEWIKKQIEEWKTWGPEGLSDDEWEYGTCLETLLENWEKENETD